MATVSTCFFFMVCCTPMTLVRLAHFQNLRLNAFDGLADLGAESDLPHGKLPERQEMLFGNANDRSQDPGLVLGILAVEVTPLTFKWVHQQVSDLGAPKIFQRAVPLSV